MLPVQKDPRKQNGLTGRKACTPAYYFFKKSSFFNLRQKMESPEIEKKSEAILSTRSLSSKTTKQGKPVWEQEQTPLTTQLPSPATEEDTSLAAPNITSKAYGKTKDSPSIMSKISSIKD